MKETTGTPLLISVVFALLFSMGVVLLDIQTRGEITKLQEQDLETLDRVLETLEGEKKTLQMYDELLDLITTIEKQSAKVIGLLDMNMRVDGTEAQIATITNTLGIVHNIMENHKRAIEKHTHKKKGWFRR